MSIVLVPKAAYDVLPPEEQDKIRYAFPDVELRFDTAPTTTTDGGVECYLFCDQRLPAESAAESVE